MYKNEIVVTLWSKVILMVLGIALIISIIIQMINPHSVNAGPDLVASPTNSTIPTRTPTPDPNITPTATVITNNYLPAILKEQ